MHTDIAGDSNSPAYNRFLNYVKAIIADDRMNTFSNIVTFPLQTVNFANQLLDHFKAIYRGKDKHISAQFNSETDKDSFEKYLKEIGFHKKMTTDYFNIFKTYYNSFVVVDMPAEATTPAAPYVSFKQVSSAHSLSLNSDKTINWVCFKNDDRYLVYTSNEYISIPIIDGKVSYTGVIQNDHSLGYCPVTTYNDYIKGITVNSPLAKIKGDLDRLLFRQVSKDVADLYVPFPVSVIPGQDDEFNDESNKECVDNLSMKEKLTGNFSTKTKKESNLAGAGAVIEWSGDEVKASDAVSFISPDVEGIKYYTEDIGDIKEAIEVSVTGKVSDNNNVSKNESQILNTAEAKTTILNVVKSGFEHVYKFAYDTIARLRYNTFVNSSINFGSEFGTLKADELIVLYNSMKGRGADKSELDVIQNSIIEQQYKNDSNIVERIKFLKKLEPFRHLTDAEVITLYDKGVVTKNELLLKTRFSDYISRFENEYFDVTEFNKDVAIDKRIKVILNIINKYIEENGSNGQKPISNE